MTKHLALLTLPVTRNTALRIARKEIGDDCMQTALKRIQTSYTE